MIAMKPQTLGDVQFLKISTSQTVFICLSYIVYMSYLFLYLKLCQPCLAPSLARCFFRFAGRATHFSGRRHSSPPAPQYNRAILASPMRVVEASPARSDAERRGVGDILCGKTKEMYGDVQS